MKKLIIVLISLLAIQANAITLKTNLGIENYQTISQSNGSCTRTYIGTTLVDSNCSSSVDKKQASALKAAIGARMAYNEFLGVEGYVGINSLQNGSIELLGVYTLNPKVDLKAGVNMSQDLNNQVIKAVKPGLGLQAGVSYKVLDKTEIYGSIGSKSQSFENKYGQGERETLTSVTGQVGISFSF